MNRGNKWEFKFLILGFKGLKPGNFCVSLSLSLDKNNYIPFNTSKTTLIFECDFYIIYLQCTAMLPKSGYLVRSHLASYFCSWTTRKSQFLHRNYMLGTFLSFRALGRLSLQPSVSRCACGTQVGSTAGASRHLLTQHWRLSLSVGLPRIFLSAKPWKL